MTGPRIEVRLDCLRHNAEVLVRRLAGRGIAVCGVTKATLGSPEVAAELVAAGVTSIGESRIENVERLRTAGVTTPIALVRAPLPSQVERVVAAADLSLNTELEVIAALSAAAVQQGRRHGVVLMVELGDLREGILPADVEPVAATTLRLPGVVLRGIGTNLACQSGVVPDERNMAELSALATRLEARLDTGLEIVSGGNSANLAWAFSTPTPGRVNHLRLGEAILLGCEPSRRLPIDGLRTDVFTVIGEIIESKAKPSVAWGDVAETAFGAPTPATAAGTTTRVLVGLGRQDTDPAGLTSPPGTTVLGASSDVVVLDAGDACPPVGAEVRFGVGYGALLAAMTSPFVRRNFLSGDPARVSAPLDEPPRPS